ncbi:MAG TPA: ABC transporter permease [Herpetosiphonaceae bacterium]
MSLERQAPAAPQLSPPQHGAAPQGVSSLRRLWAARWLMATWLKYNIQLRYRQKILGILWIALLPVAQSLVFSLVFSRLLNYQVGPVPFISFYLTGLIGWSIFSNGLHKGLVALEGQREVLNQVYFPREILVIIQLAEVVIDAAFMGGMLIAINAWHGILPSAALLFLPLLLAIQLPLTLGFMFVLAQLSILVRDVQPLVVVITMLLFYLTPVIYPLAALPAELQGPLALNPLSALLESYRAIFLYGMPPSLPTLAYPAALSLAVGALGYRFFKKIEPVVIDIL